MTTYTTLDGSQNSQQVDDIEEEGEDDEEENGDARCGMKAHAVVNAPEDFLEAHAEKFRVSTEELRRFAQEYTRLVMTAQGR